ncbi:unnamed protein product [Microthlaspi erraticum]|uniref:Protein RALF-like 27 n=1 Tax=Microthlaspi erraticum TaxID=1685480 RepID=A0A6D2K533_9BRAS|nr:unnamed protein product [Microthlaspi erraticum]
MTKSVFSIFFFFFFTVSLLLLLAATLTSASAGNATSELIYGGCAPGDTVGECITAANEEKEEEEGVEEQVVRRILQQRRQLSYEALQKGAPCNPKIYSNCIGQANGRASTCTYFNRCKRA